MPVLNRSFAYTKRRPISAICDDLYKSRLSGLSWCTLNVVNWAESGRSTSRPIVAIRRSSKLIQKRTAHQIDLRIQRLTLSNRSISSLNFSRCSVTSPDAIASATQHDA
jgi:hypothetical protein